MLGGEEGTRLLDGELLEEEVSKVDFGTRPDEVSSALEVCLVAGASSVIGEGVGVVLGERGVEVEAGGGRPSRGELGGPQVAHTEDVFRHDVDGLGHGEGRVADEEGGAFLGVEADDHGNASAAGKVGLSDPVRVFFAFGGGAGWSGHALFFYSGHHCVADDVAEKKGYFIFQSPGTGYL